MSTLCRENCAIVGFYVWLGFVATTTISAVLWEEKSFFGYLIDNGYRLLSIMVMAAILAVWR